MDQTNKQVLTVDGYIPLYYAGCMYYNQILLPALEKAQYTLDSWKNDSKKKDRKFIFVTLPDFKSKLNLTCDNGTQKTYTLDVLHYGPRKKDSKNPRDRDLQCWERMNTLSAFRSGQSHMKKLGYYLVEEGNTTYGHDIKLYNCVPSYPVKKLWHDYNKIHGILTKPEDRVKKVEVKIESEHNKKGKKNNNEEQLNFNDNEFPALPTKPKQEVDENVPLEVLDLENRNM